MTKELQRRNKKLFQEDQNSSDHIFSLLEHIIVWVQSIAHQFGCRMALIGVFTTTIHGIMTDSDFEGTIKTTFVIAAACYGLGLFIGDIGRRLVEEQIRQEIEQAKFNEN